MLIEQLPQKVTIYLLWHSLFMNDEASIRHGTSRLNFLSDGT